MASGELTNAGTHRTTAGGLAPGVRIGRGRYRLLTKVGEDTRCSAELWRGSDAVLEREVAMTLFTAQPVDQHGANTMRGAVQRALRVARLDTPGVARVLDVLEPESGKGPLVAAVITEWTTGHDLTQVVTTKLPTPGAAARILLPLADAVDHAHRAGLVLGCDHPHRIKLTPEGYAVLAFPGPSAQSGPPDDVCGLGAALYLLLTGHWPLPGGPPGIPPPPTDPAGVAVAPHWLHPEIPIDLSELAIRSIGGRDNNRIRTGAGVRRILETHAEPDPDPEAEALIPLAEAKQQAQARRKRMKLGISVAVLLVVLLSGAGWLVTELTSLFTGEDDDAPVLVVEEPTEGGGPQEQPPPPPPPAGPAPVAGLHVYDISGQGSPDNADRVGLLVDGDPTSEWSTDSYLQPFPSAFKQGLGVMLDFTAPTEVTEVAITSPSEGTEVEIRTAPTPAAPLEQTVVVGRATLQDGVTTIRLNAAPPTPHLLMWITGLAGGGEQNQSSFGEIVVQQARAG